MPPTDVATEAQAASINTTSVRGGQQHPWYLTYQGPWDHCGRSSQVMLRDLCKQLALILGGVSGLWLWAKAIQMPFSKQPRVHFWMDRH